MTNGVNATITYDAMKNKRTGYWSSFVKGSDKPNEHGVLDNRSDLLEIKLTDDADFEIGNGSGSYLESIKFDNRVFWSIKDKHMVSKWAAPAPEHILPSDSSRRTDLIAITAENWEEAEAQKHELEELQRHDKKLREASGKGREAPEEEVDYY